MATPINDYTDAVDYRAAHVNTGFKDCVAAMDMQKKHYEREIKLLKRAARLIHDRRNMVSGSLQMAECDEVCGRVGLKVWEWPL